MEAHDRSWKLVSEDMLRRARGHRIVAGVSMASAIILLLGGFSSVILGMSAKPELKGMVADGVLRVLVISLIVLGAQLLVQMYRFNMRVYQHWVSRAYALALVQKPDVAELRKLIELIARDPVEFDSLPNKPFFQAGCEAGEK